ncbi:hypothetical protein ONE62_42785 (plasmid) [Rhodococcus opacus]|nr:hypothetical protein ONE62_42785 [Rhodococcus opacus]
MSEDRITGRIRLQEGDSKREFCFDTSHTFGEGCSWHSEWPFDEYRIRNNFGELMSRGVVSALGEQVTGKWPIEADKHHVLYVGQAFGKDGERTAWDRLSNHETVQKILAETRRDQQVWISMAAITDINLWDETIPGRCASMQSSENARHIDEVYASIIGSSDFKDREAVSLAEAGLIRYFQPEYNDRLKNNFPARNQVSLELLRKLDVYGLIVELQGMDVRAEYGSNLVLPKSIHFAGYEVHLDPDRSGLTLEATDNFPGKRHP